MIPWTNDFMNSWNNYLFIQWFTYWNSWLCEWLAVQILDNSDSQVFMYGNYWITNKKRWSNLTHRIVHRLYSLDMVCLFVISHIKHDTHVFVHRFTHQLVHNELSELMAIGTLNGVCQPNHHFKVILIWAKTTVLRMMRLLRRFAAIACKLTDLRWFAFFGVLQMRMNMEAVPLPKCYLPFVWVICVKSGILYEISSGSE